MMKSWHRAGGSARVHLAARVCLCVMSGFLVSCPPPFNNAAVLHLKDAIGPVITLTSPAEGSSYGSTVIVSGIVRDAASATGASGKVKRLSYEIVPATLPGGTVPVDDDGGFTFRFDTGDFSGPMVIRLTAEDWNGNTSVVELNLVDKGAIPSFRANAGNHQVGLEWDPVPLTGGYTLYYTTDGTLPSPTYGNRLDGVETPFVLDGLANGTMHVFLLQAHAREGRDNWSDYCRAVPLSERTLAPNVTGRFRKILVEWGTIAATDEFEVLRSECPDGSFASVSGGIRGNRFEDSLVQQGVSYWYKVRPNLPDSIESMAVAGTPGEWPTSAERRIGHYPTAGPALGLALRGGYGFVACSNAGLAILDLSNPSSPSLVRSVEVPGPACNVFLDETRALVAGGDSGLHIYDITGPTTLEYRGSFAGDTPPTVSSVATRGDIAYTAGGNFDVIDISDPGSPVLLHSLAHGDQWFPYYSTDVITSGEYAFVIHEGLEVHDISDPANPVFDVAKVAGVGKSIYTGAPQRLSMLGNYVYAPAGEEGVKIFDASIPSATMLVATLDTRGFATGTAVSGNRAFVADGPWGGMLGIDVSVPWDPSPISCIDTPGDAFAIAVSGDVAYVADGGAGLQVIDTRVPRPEVVSSFAVPSTVNDIALVGSRAYVTYGANDGLPKGLLIVDLSIPSLPSVIGSVDMTKPALGVAVSGSLAFVGNMTDGLRVVDVSDPGNAAVIGTYSYATTTGAVPVSILGDRVSVGFSLLGMVILDVSKPEQPSFISSANDGRIGMTLYGIEMAGTHVYTVGDNFLGLAIFDISDPSAPKMAAEVDLPAFPCAVAVSDRYAFVADDTQGLQIVDISNPSAPFVAGAYIPAGDPDCRDIEVSGSYAFVADDTLGLLILDTADPSAPLLAARVPASATAAAVSGRLAVVSDGMSCLVVDLMTEE
jgi:hypothetical protein